MPTVLFMRTPIWFRFYITVDGYGNRQLSYLDVLLGTHVLTPNLGKAICNGDPPG